MNEVQLSGVAALNEADLRETAEHVSDKSCWAKLVAKKQKPEVKSSEVIKPSEVNSSEVKSTMSSGALVGKATSSSIVQKPKKYVIPQPGRDGPANSMAGKTFVMTGIFPEIGGGGGLDLGKDRVKEMITAFGGKVTSAISGRTDVLVVGKEPGMSKVSKARARDHIRLMTLDQVTEGLHNGEINVGALAVTQNPQVSIGAFSSGYNGNSLAFKASAAAIDAARYGQASLGPGPQAQDSVALEPLKDSLHVPQNAKSVPKAKKIEKKLVEKKKKKKGNVPIPPALKAASRGRKRKESAKSIDAAARKKPKAVSD